MRASTTFRCLKQKLAQKVEKLRKMEKRYNDLSKIKNSVSTASAGDSERKVQI